VGDFKMGHSRRIRLPWSHTLTFRLTVWVGVALIVVIGISTYYNFTTQRKNLLDEVILGAKQLSGTLTRSLRFDMHHNFREAVHHSIETVATQEEIEKVRIFNKEGQIMFSSDKAEIGKMVGKTAEACYACHVEGKPLEKLDTPGRARIFNAKGHRILGMITPIYNERDCYTAPCHAHPPEQKVLGVFDITLSLANTDRIMKQIKAKSILFAGVTILVVSFVIILMIHRQVYRPVKELVKATTSVAAGNFDYDISIKSHHEVGKLTESFKKMTERLKKADDDIKELVKTLEDKVEERTSELKSAQFQLLQSEKLASIGKLSATIAHEINNPLNGILTYTKLIERKLNNGNFVPSEIPKLSSYLTVMAREIQRCSSIVRNLLDFARQREPSLRTDVNINTVIEDAIVIIANQITLNQNELVKNFNHVPSIVADPMQLRQAFLNIIINSCEAVKEGGRITVGTNFLENEETVMVRVTDNGVGIEPGDLSRIFDPFFTTKEKGTGLGLSVVYGIINSHHGTLKIESTPGQGTMVTIKLPRAVKQDEMESEGISGAM
jgi:two-component system NtrC family sensor kinase